MYYTKYRDDSSNPKENAQRNLCGRSHYVDDGTLRFHRSRILVSGATDCGLGFWLIESVAADMNNTRRGFRAVVFGLAGDVIGERPGVDDLRRTSNQARDDLNEMLRKIDFRAAAIEAVKRDKEAAGLLLDELRA